ncbi:unnamed protein product [Effrenium voratum]|uniref:BolA-like protein n=1 Tax=Effrenium voratum TaxID=2562239 RepID=A0AA36JBR1_9DINO|nr:unnamed protein product [Effrenium voratum]
MSKDGWPSCPHAQTRLRQQLEAQIPDITYLDLQDLSQRDSSDQAEACEDQRQVKLGITVVSQAFQGLPRLQRHRMVHSALQRELAQGAIHALPEMKTFTPEEWFQRDVRDAREWVEPRLRQAISQIEHLEVQDVTNGHAVVGYLDGSRRALNPNGLELELLVVSSSFANMKTLQRQQLVNGALAKELMSGEIHALPRMKVYTPDQWERLKSSQQQPQLVSDMKRQKLGTQCA